MSDLVKDETVIEIVEVSKNCYCRGSWDCKYWRGKYIPKGTKALRIKIDSAGGFAQAYYCEKCMPHLIKMCKKAIKMGE